MQEAKAKLQEYRQSVSASMGEMRQRVEQVESVAESRHALKMQEAASEVLELRNRLEQVESEKAGILLSGRQLEQRVSDRQSEQLTELRLSQEREAETQREVERLRQALRQSELDTRSAHARLAEAAVASPVSRNREVLSTSAGRDD